MYLKNSETYNVVHACATAEEFEKVLLAYGQKDKLPDDFLKKLVKALMVDYVKLRDPHWSKILVSLSEYDSRTLAVLEKLHEVHYHDYPSEPIDALKTLLAVKKVLQKM